ncbi:MAG: hypothetical protein IPK35_03335 [Saprospiraceae bacterium]|jgi:hypothetical protein|nr:hypothetical protein [Saprospiraceae bacterium]
MDCQSINFPLPDNEHLNCSDYEAADGTLTQEGYDIYCLDSYELNNYLDVLESNCLQIATNENKDVVDFTSWQGSLLVHPFRKERWLGTLTIGDIIWRYQYPDPLPGT